MFEIKMSLNRVVKHLKTTVAESLGIKLMGGTGKAGTLSWNAIEETVDLNQGTSVMQVGQELHVQCRNLTPSAIPAGRVVMVTGSVGSPAMVTVAPYDGTTDAKYILGVTVEEIPVSGDGKVTVYGKVRNLDTSSFSSGTLLYAIADGQFTSVEPTTGASNAIAMVVNSDATTGTLFIRTTAVGSNKIDGVHVGTINGVAGTINVGSTNTTNTGINNQIYGDGAGHSLTYGTNNIAQGFNAGRSNSIGSNWVAQGANAGLSNTNGSNWVAQGFNAGRSNRTGGNWVAQGVSAGLSSTTGGNWVAQGVSAGLSSTTGSNWVAQGVSAGLSSTTGSNWVAQGFNAGLSNTNGSNWVAQGANAGLSNTNGSNWVAQGANAGRYLTNGTSDATSFYSSVYIGADTKVSANGVTNETVIGYNAIGNGSNTVTLGSDAVTKTVLKGNVGIGTATPTHKTEVNGTLGYRINIQNKAANYSVAITDSGDEFRSTTATVTGVLPAPTVGAVFTFSVSSSGESHTIQASSGTTIRNSTSGAITSSGGTMHATSVGSYMTIVAVSATEWEARAVAGTWVTT